MSTAPPARRGPLTPMEQGDFHRFLRQPVTLESLAAFGAAMALSCLECRMAFGVALPAATRRGYWWRLVDLRARLSTSASPEAPAMATAKGRERQRREVESALLAFRSYCQTHIVPRLGPWSASSPQDDPASPEISGGQVLPFGSFRRPDGQADKDARPSRHVSTE